MVIQCNTCAENGIASSICFESIQIFSQHLFSSHGFERITCGQNFCLREYSTDQKYNFTRHLQRIHKITFKDWKPSEKLYSIISDPNLNLDISDILIQQDQIFDDEISMDVSPQDFELLQDPESDEIQPMQESEPSQDIRQYLVHFTEHEVNRNEDGNHLDVNRNENEVVHREDADVLCYREVTNELSGARNSNMACSITRLKSEFNMSERCVAGILDWTDILLARAQSAFVGGLKTTLSNQTYGEIEHVTQVASGVSNAFYGLETEKKRMKHLKNLVVSFLKQVFF